MNDNIMLDEEETLALLRAGRTGTEPPLTDVTGVALAGGRRLRMRRRSGQAAAGLVLAAAASLAIATAMPSLNFGTQAAVQPATGGGTGKGATVVTEADAEVNNRQVLAAGLGPDWRVTVTDGIPRFATVSLVPASPSADRLPTGYQAAPEIELAEGFTQVDEPCNPADKAAATGACAHRPLPGGGEVLFSTVKSEDAGHFAAATTAYFRRPDGNLARATLWVTPIEKGLRADAATRTAVLDWLRGFDDGLAAAATDPRLSMSRTPATGQTSDARYQDERNRDYLLETLGAGWELFGSGFRATPGGPAASGLPAAYSGRASVRVSDGGLVLVEYCREVVSAGSTCELRELSEGRTVAVLQQALKSAGEDRAFGAFSIVYVQPDTGDTVTVEANVFATDLRPGAVVADHEAVEAWMAGFESELIKAATDVRMAKDTENH